MWTRSSQQGRAPSTHYKQATVRGVASGCDNYPTATTRHNYPTGTTTSATTTTTTTTTQPHQKHKTHD